MNILPFFDLKLRKDEVYSLTLMYLYKLGDFCETPEVTKKPLSINDDSL